MINLICRINGSKLCVLAYRNGSCNLWLRDWSSLS